MFCNYQQITLRCLLWAECAKFHILTVLNVFNSIIRVKHFYFLFCKHFFPSLFLLHAICHCFQPRHSYWVCVWFLYLCNWWLIVMRSRLTTRFHLYALTNTEPVSTFLCFIYFFLLRLFAFFDIRWADTSFEYIGSIPLSQNAFYVFVVFLIASDSSRFVQRILEKFNKLADDILNRWQQTIRLKYLTLFVSHFKTSFKTIKMARAFWIAIYFKWQIYIESTSIKK